MVTSNDYLRKVFSTNLKKMMEEHGKLQIDLMRDLGLKSSTVSEWVRGKKYPRVDKVQLLADYFNCNPTDLVGTEQEYFATVCNRRTANINERIANMLEELTLRKVDFYYEEQLLDNDDIDLLKRTIITTSDLFRAALKNKYSGGNK